jgi:hypothetical protein
MGMQDKKAWRLILRKLDYLRLEVESRQQALKEVEADFEKRISEIDPTFSIHEDPPSPVGSTGEVGIVPNVKTDLPPPPLQGDEDPVEIPDVESKDPAELSQSFKRLWKLIAARTHPDATDNDEELLEVYKSAAKAFEDGNSVGLIEAAAQITLTPKQIDDDVVQAARDRIQELSKQLDKLEKNSLMEWSAASKKVQDAFVEGILNIRKQRKA